MIDWSRYPNFSAKEFACQHCGQGGVDERLLFVLQEIRQDAGFPFIITSGFRCNEHPIEKKKSSPGVHADGLAVDISCSGGQAHKLLKLILQRNVPGIGIQQKGSGRFIHMDIAENKESRPRPWIWSY